MKHDNSREHAFLMVDYDTSPFITDLQNSINPEELYFEEGSTDYGLELNSHVTLVPCLANDVDLERLKTYLETLSNYDIILTDISKFDCDKYDVLKCAASSDTLFKTNERIRKDFDTFSEYDEYKPHLTIAYMKHGMADKYLKDILPKLIHLKPKNFHFSFVDKNGDHKEVTFEL